MPPLPPSQRPASPSCQSRGLAGAGVRGEGGTENSPQVLSWLRDDWEARLIGACTIFRSVGQVCGRGEGWFCFCFMWNGERVGSEFLILIYILALDFVAYVAFLAQWINYRTMIWEENSKAQCWGASTYTKGKGWKRQICFFFHNLWWGSGVFYCACL